MLCKDRAVPYVHRPEDLTYSTVVPHWCKDCTVHTLARARAELSTNREALAWAGKRMGYVMEACVAAVHVAFLLGQCPLWSGAALEWKVQLLPHDM